MLKRLILVMVVFLAGCTVTLDNPLVKKDSDEVKLARKEIEMYELLERRAELVLSITDLKQATEGAKFEPVPGPQGPRGPRGLPGDDSAKGLKGEKVDPNE